VQSIVDQHQSGLLRYVASLTGNVEEARDIVQDTFIRLCTQDRSAVDGHVAAWLFRVARNRTVDRQRKEHRMQTLSKVDWESQATEASSPADNAVQNDTSSAVLRLIGNLPDNQREVVRLKFQNQLSYQEIADITSLSVSNVGFLLHTAIRTLRRELADLDTNANAQSRSV